MAKKKNTSTTRMTVRNTQAPKLVARPAIGTAREVVLEATAVAMAPAATEARVVATASAVTEPPLVIDRAQIARLAFAKFAARGFVHGFHVADWLEAEAELRATRR